jgi:accessory gene regulator protein AgrB
MFKFHKKFVELRKKLNKINTIPYNILEFGLKVVINSVNLMKLMVVFSFVIINESSSERPIYEIFVNK